MRFWGGLLYGETINLEEGTAFSARGGDPRVSKANELPALPPSITQAINATPTTCPAYLGHHTGWGPGPLLWDIVIVRVVWQKRGEGEAQKPGT